MTINKAVERIKWRMQNGWKPNSNDVDALNSIVSFVNDQHSKKINDHQLFAKLYVFVYSQFLVHYGTNVFDSIPQKELHKILEKDLVTHIENLTKQMNESGIYERMSEAGISKEHPATRTKEQKEKEIGLMTVEMLEPVWDTETVTDNIRSMINLAINEYA